MGLPDYLDYSFQTIEKKGCELVILERTQSNKQLEFKHVNNIINLDKRHTLPETNIGPEFSGHPYHFQVQKM